MELQQLFAKNNEDLHVLIYNTVTDEVMEYMGGRGLTAFGFQCFANVMDVTLEEGEPGELTAVCMSREEWEQILDLLGCAAGACTRERFALYFCDIDNTVVQDEEPEDISPCVGCSLEFTTDCCGCEHWRGNND